MSATPAPASAATAAPAALAGANPAGGGAAASAPAVPRPSVLSLAIKDKPNLFAAYMPYLKNGGIFVPTNRSYKIGDEIYLILSLMDEPNKHPIAGKVAWITPAGANNRAQGIGVHFPADESGRRVRQSIESLLGSALRSTRSTTHTL